jgi:hypothetical protein
VDDAPSLGRLFKTPSNRSSKTQQKQVEQAEATDKMNKRFGCATDNPTQHERTSMNVLKMRNESVVESMGKAVAGHGDVKRY